MSKILYVGLDVHKESIVAATAVAGDKPAELYGKIGGTLDALDKLLNRLGQPAVVYTKALMLWHVTVPASFNRKLQN